MISIFELFKVGIGPSSSHTVGPMKAALAFVRALEAAGLAERTARLRVDLFGSLAWTGKGHGTDKATMLGLAGEAPESVDPDRADALVESLSREKRLPLGGGAADRLRSGGGHRVRRARRDAAPSQHHGAHRL